MNVTFVARAIDGMAGGVERMVTIIMNAMIARRHKVNLITWDNAKATSYYPMDQRIKWYKINMGDASEKAGTLLRLRRAKFVRDLIRQNKTEIIVCFQDGPFMAFRAYTAGMGVPIIAAERNAPTRFEHTTAVRRKNLTYLAFNGARKIMVQFEDYRCLYPAFLHKRIVAIPNPVFSADSYAEPGSAGTDGRFRVLSVGRFGFQKNYPTLVAAFEQLAWYYPDWDLVLLGNGEDRTTLERMIADKGLSDRIFLPGATTNISRWYTASNVFCLASRWEGFPNALAEALAHGLPCVGYSDCAGVKNLILPGKNGLLAEGNGDPKSLAGALRMLMDSTEVRSSMGKNAVESVKCYDPGKVFSLWEQVLAESKMQ